jgi:hypothetical protein
MAHHSAIPLGVITLVVASAAHAAEDTSFRQSPEPQAIAASPNAKADKVEKQKDDERERRGSGWMLSLEGVGNAPVDLGAQVGLETPFGLRVFAGYGWIPAASLRWLEGTSIADGAASATVDVADAAGHILRVKVGFRPFSRLGLYLDAGYARADLAANVDVTGAVTNLGSVSGGYSASSSVDLWLVELGYQWLLERRLVVGLGLGFMGTIDARTTITPIGAAVNSSALGVAQTAVNGALEGYGFIPTLSLRVGFNVL